MKYDTFVEDVIRIGNIVSDHLSVTGHKDGSKDFHGKCKTFEHKPVYTFRVPTYDMGFIARLSWLLFGK